MRANGHIPARVAVAALFIGVTTVARSAEPAPPQQGQSKEWIAPPATPGAGWITPQASPPYLPPAPMSESDMARVRQMVVNQKRGELLTPEEIGNIKNDTLNAQGQKFYPGYPGAALPSARRLTIRFSPKTATSSNRPPDKIRLSLGTISAVSFKDAKGRPWPIVNVGYDPSTFSVGGNGCGANLAGGGGGQGSAQGGQGAAGGLGQVVSGLDEGARPTSFYAAPCRFWTWGNFLVQLQGLTEPIILLASSGHDPAYPYVDIPIVVYVDGVSPTGGVAGVRRGGGPSAPSGPAAAEPFDPALALFLKNTPPRGASPVRTSNGDVRAWRYDNRVYVRGPMTVQAPDYQAHVKGNGQEVVRYDAANVWRVRATMNDGSEDAIAIDN